MRIYTQTDFTDLLGAQEYYLIVSLISGWKLQRQMLQVFVCVLKRVSICLHVGKMLNNFNDHIWIVIRGLSIIFVSFTLRETERERVGQRGSEKVKIFFPSSLNHQDASCGFLLLWIHCVCVRACARVCCYVCVVFHICCRSVGNPKWMAPVYPLQNDSNTKEAHNFILIME